MNVIGLDLSSTCSGICLPDGTTEHFKPKGGLLERAIATKRWVADWAIPADAELAVIEDIGTRFVQTAIAIAYVHCQIDDLLQKMRVIKLSPAELKRFATGKGNADKDVMLSSAIRAGSGANTNDEADAWWLWALGNALVGEWVVDGFNYRDDILAQIAKAAA